MVTQSFDLNMIPGKPKPIIRASQYDTGLRAFEVSLFAGTEEYSIPSGATLTVQGTKPDYTGFSYSATYSGNTVSFDCTDQMTACAGAVEVEIVVVNEGERVATANFVLQVEPAALKDDTIISETDIPIIEQLPEMLEDMDKLISTFGGPNVAETAAEMTDQDKVYVYIGSETGYNSGHWYYYDQTDHVWKDGGIYQSAGMDLDTTLSVSGKAADAKAVGDALALKANLASPTFTGYPKAPTASLLSYGTQIANTEFVQRLVMPLDDAVNGLEPTEVPMHLVVDGTTGTWEQGGKTYTYDLLPGDEVKVTAGERDAYLVWYTIRGGSTAVDVSTSHTLTAGSTRQWGTTDARTLAVLMEDASGNDVSPAVFTINGIEKGLTERVDELEATKQDTLTFDSTPTEGSINPVTSGGVYTALEDAKDDAEEATAEAREIALKAFATPTASGQLVTLTDGADGIPAKKLTLNLAPHQSGSGDPSPENVRSISGWNSVNVYRAGKNLIDWDAFYATANKTRCTVSQDENGLLTVTSNTTGAMWVGMAVEEGSQAPANTYKIPAIKGQTFALHNDAATSGSLFFEIAEDLTVVARANTVSEYTIQSSECRYLGFRFSFGSATAEGQTKTCHAWVSAGGASSEFEKFKEMQTYTITIPTAAGTVYGGSLEINDDGSGALVVDRGFVNLTGGSNEDWRESSTSYYCRFDSAIFSGKTPTPNRNDIICNRLIGVGTGTAGLAIRKNAFPDTVTSLAECIAWIQANNLECVYPLADPQTYTLSVEEVTTLLGSNTLFMSADGTIDLAYRADTTLYINNLITGIRNNIAYIEDGTTASRAYSVGQYVLIGGQLYKVAASIASGATFTIGTNVTATTVGTELTALN